MMKRVSFVFLILLVCSGCSFGGCSGACTRVLFLGNSYTFVNDLPGTFADLARAGGHAVETGMVAQGGWSLTDLLNSPDTTGELNSAQWDYVVLQEQSQIPSIEQVRTQQMYPAARSLVREAGATPMFFVTWAHRGGWPENGIPDYESMQARIDRGYMTIAGELGAPVAPVGYAWFTVGQKHPEIDLWQGDGSHPTQAGTYLAASVFYAAIFRESPEELTYTAGLPEETAQALQQVASDTVLSDPGQWNLH